MVNQGEVAPLFKLPSTHGEFELNHQNNKNIIMIFYPEDNTPVCTSQLALYNEILPMFEEYDATIVAISVDKPKVHENFAQKLNLKYPLLSDYDPRGHVAKLYGVFDEDYKRSQRAIFVIDKQGIIRWKYISPPQINPGADGILTALEEL